MSNDHEALLGELRLLADVVLDRIEAVAQQLASTPADNTEADVSADVTDRSATETHPPASGGSSWCPLCAGAAFLRGENHELLNRLATGLAALIALLRELVARYLPAPSGPAPDHEPPPEPPDRGSRYESISVTIRS